MRDRREGGMHAISDYEVSDESTWECAIHALSLITWSMKKEEEEEEEKEEEKEKEKEEEKVEKKEEEKKENE